jgi:hypothetical protein
MMRGWNGRRGAFDPSAALKAVGAAAIPKAVCFACIERRGKTILLSDKRAARVDFARKTVSLRHNILPYLSTLGNS